MIGLLLVFAVAWFSGAFSRPQATPRNQAPESKSQPVVPSAEESSLSPLEAALGDLDKLPPEVKRYLDSTVYPPGTGRLTKDHVDLLEPNRRYEDFRPIPATMSMDPNEVVSVRLTSEQYFYTGDEPVNVDLHLRLGSRPIRALSLDANLAREGRGGDEGRLVPLRFTQELEGYSARIDTTRFADHHGNLRLDVRLEFAPGQFHDESLRLFLTPEGMIPARFSGQVRDQVVGGNLRILVGVRVEQAGYYRIDANLSDRFGQPVAFSSFKGQLTRSDKEIPIDFFGRLLHDVEVSGPFYVDQVRGYRFIDGGHPDRERIPDLAGRYPTEFADLSLLSHNAYAGAEKLHMVSLMMQDVANGISLDAPSSPGAPPSPSPAGAAP